MAVRTRKSTSSLPTEPVVDAAAAPTRRRVPGTRAAATRRPATSSRTLRPILPPESSATTDSEAVVEAPVPEVAPAAEVAPVAAAAPVIAQELLITPESTPAELLVSTPVTEDPAVTAEVVVITPLAALPVTEIAAEVLLVSPPVELPAAEVPVARLPAASEFALPEVLPVPGVELPLMVEQLQADVRALQGLVTGHTEQTVHELSRTTMQMVRMVTGVAHHLDQLAEQVQQLSGVAQTLAQTLTRVEGTVATLHTRTQEQILLSSRGQRELQEQILLAARGQRELQDVLAPVLSELLALRAQAARNTSIDRLDQFRMGVELKQLRHAVEKHGPTPELASALPKPARAPRTKR